MCATHCSWMYRTETEADAASPVESARSSDPRFYRAGQTGSSSWLVAVRHFRHAVAGRPGPMSTRGALATMPFPSSALRNWALCARMTAAPRTADGRCPQASPPYVDRAPWSSIAWGRSAATANLSGAARWSCIHGRERPRNCSPRLAGQKGSL